MPCRNKVGVEKMEEPVQKEKRSLHFSAIKLFTGRKNVYPLVAKLKNK